MKMESVKAWLQQQDDEFFASVSEAIAKDRGIDFDPEMDEQQQQRGVANKKEEEYEEEPNYVHSDPYSTKTELYRYFSGQGPTEMISNFLHDERNRGLAVILCDLSEPLESEYTSNQDTMSSGPEEALLWAAKRAGGSWFQMIMGIADILQSIEFSRHLRLTPAAFTPLVEAPDWLRIEFQLLDAAWDFAMHLMSAILWANMMHTYRLPHATAVYLLPESKERDLALERVKAMVKTMLKVS
eukprot:s3933_g4.t1